MKKYTHSIAKSFAALAAVVTLAGAGCAFADDKHDHDHDHDHSKIEAGPNGGRILNVVEPHLEFFVTKDRKVQISAVGEDGKIVPIEKQVVKVTGGSRSNPTRMTFEKKGDVLISDVAFPEGNDFPVVVQIKPKKIGKSVMAKFNLNLSDCPTCEYKEYACTCDHGHDHDHDHKDHKH